MDPNPHQNTAPANTDTHNTHNPLTGDGVTNTHNPLTGDKIGSSPPAGTNPITGRTEDDNLGRNEQQPSETHRTDATRTGAGVISDTDTHNTHNPLTGDGVTNTHNPMTGDKTGPHPPPDTNPVTGRTDDGNLGRNEQQPAGHTDAIGTDTKAPTDAHTSTGTSVTSGTNTHNTHNPLTGDSVTNTHNPMTGDKTGPHPPPDTNLVTGRTDDGNLGRNGQQPASHTDVTGMDTKAHTGAYTGTGAGVTSETNTHNTHNPLTGDGVTNTRNPMTGDKTGPHPPADTNPVTGRTNDGNLGRNEQQPATADTTDGHTSTHTTGAHTGTHTAAGADLASGTNTHNTHNPLTGDGVTNTRNPLTGDKTGPHPPPGTNPVTGRTRDGNLGRNEQQPAGQPSGHAGITGTTGTTGATGTGPHTIHDTTRGAYTSGAMGTTGTTDAGPHSTSKQSGGGAKAVVGRVEATLGSLINNSEMHAKGVQKQEEAQAAKLAKQEAEHGGANVRH